MHVHPAIAALRANPGLQRRAQSRLDKAHKDWLTSGATQDLQNELLLYGEGAELEQLSCLQTLITDHSMADEMVRTHRHAMIKALRQEPLGEVPLRQTTSAGFSRLQLIKGGNAVLSLCAYEPAPYSGPPNLVQFADCELHELVLAGGARGQFHQLNGRKAYRTLCSKSHHWRNGDTITCRALRSTRQIVTVSETLLVLQLTRTPQSPLPTLELALPSGEKLRQISGDKKASEQLMALGVLGALGDHEALTPMEHFAVECGNDEDARWEAVRQLIARDSERGMVLLDRLVQQADDPLQTPAMRLRQQILDAYPILIKTPKGLQ